MKYDLFTFVGKETLPLTNYEFDTYNKARTRLLAIRDIEFSLDLLLENYHEFIDDLMRLSTRYMFEDHDPYKNKIEYFITLNRKISNYFSTFFQYCEHTTANLKRGFDRKSKITVNFETSLKEVNQDNKGFLVAVALRHATQHSINPVHLIQYGGNWNNQGEQDNELLMTRIIPYLQVSYLLNDEKDTLKVFEGLFTDERRDCIDLRYIIAESMGGIVSVHSKLIVDLDRYLEEIKNTISELLNRATITQGVEIKTVYLRELDEEDIVLHNHYISSTLLDELNFLRSKHQSIANINKWGFYYAIKKDERITKRLSIS